MAVQTNTGLQMFILAESPATEDAAGYDALTGWIEVGEVVSVGEFGASTDVVTHQPLKTGITEKFKGFKNYGSYTLGMGQDLTDAGQQAIQDGVEGANEFVRHSVKLQYPSGAINYFGGKPFSYTENPGGANSIVAASTNFEIETKIVRTTATP